MVGVFAAASCRGQRHAGAVTSQKRENQGIVHFTLVPCLVQPHRAAPRPMAMQRAPLLTDSEGGGSDDDSGGGVAVAEAASRMGAARRRANGGAGPGARQPPPPLGAPAAAPGAEVRAAITHWVQTSFGARREGTGARRVEAAAVPPQACPHKAVAPCDAGEATTAPASRAKPLRRRPRGRPPVDSSASESGEQCSVRAATGKSRSARPRRAPSESPATGGRAAAARGATSASRATRPATSPPLQRARARPRPGRGVPGARECMHVPRSRAPAPVVAQEGMHRNQIRSRPRDQVLPHHYHSAIHRRAAPPPCPSAIQARRGPRWTRPRSARRGCVHCLTRSTKTAAATSRASSSSRHSGRGRTWPRCCGCSTTYGRRTARVTRSCGCFRCGTWRRAAICRRL